MRSLFFLLILVTLHAAAANELKYPVSQIQEEMKKGMYAVIRYKEVWLDIQSKSSSSYYVKQAVTILNSKAKSYAIVGVGYDKLSAIKVLKAVVYDAAGKEVRKLKQSDIRDESEYDGFSLLSDNRSKSADLSQATYPYTVEFEYEVQFNFLYSAPDFFLYRDDEVSVQQLIYSITYPVDLKPRYKIFKVHEPEKYKQADGREKIMWKFESIIPHKFEKLSVDFEKLVPNIRVSPVDFEYGGYSGKMDTWKDYGFWQSKLNDGRTILPESTKQKMRELTKEVASKEEKVRLVYEYLQNKTRYVSIQLGVGGMQPFEARTVDEIGYGDCKALSNYMVALLREINIKGYYTTINAGRGESAVDPDFPSDQSNHVIVVVPDAKDTLWLECTSQTNPFGWMGGFTDDRHALMITEHGGVLVKTPSHPSERNLQSREADVYVEMSGNARAKVKTLYQGLQYENDGLDFVVDKLYDDQKKWIQNTTHIPGFDIEKFSIKSSKNKIPLAQVEADLILNRYATVSGKRIFLTPNLMNRSTYIPEKTEKRNTDIKLRITYVDHDIIRYHLPEEIYPEFIPEPVNVRSRFGEYESSYKIDQGSLIYTRRIKMNKGEFPADSYNELIEFYKQINKADHGKMVFMNKT